MFTFFRVSQEVCAQTFYFRKDRFNDRVAKIPKLNKPHKYLPYHDLASCFYLFLFFVLVYECRQDVIVFYFLLLLLLFYGTIIHLIQGSSE